MVGGGNIPPKDLEIFEVSFLGDIQLLGYSKCIRTNNFFRGVTNYHLPKGVQRIAQVIENTSFL